MAALDVELYVGFPVDDDYRRQLSRAKQQLVDYFVDGGEAYLCRVHLDDRLYLAKRLEKPAAIEQLELIEANVRSLLQRITPEYSFAGRQLELFAAAPSSKQS